MTIEDIDKLSHEELEKISEDKSIEVPSSLGAKIEAAMMSAAIIAEKKPAAKRLWIPSMSLAFASVAVLLAVYLNEPKDSFSDPMLAYAEVEKTFDLISAKMSKGETATMELAETVSKMNEIMSVYTK